MNYLEIAGNVNIPTIRGIDITNFLFILLIVFSLMVIFDNLFVKKDYNNNKIKKACFIVGISVFLMLLANLIPSVFNYLLITAIIAITLYILIRFWIIRKNLMKKYDELMIIEKENIKKYGVDPLVKHKKHKIIKYTFVTIAGIIAFLTFITYIYPYGKYNSAYFWTDDGREVRIKKDGTCLVELYDDMTSVTYVGTIKRNPILTCNINTDVYFDVGEDNPSITKVTQSHSFIIVGNTLLSYDSKHGFHIYIKSFR